MIPFRKLYTNPKPEFLIMPTYPHHPNAFLKYQGMHSPHYFRGTMAKTKGFSV